MAQNINQVGYGLSQALQVLAPFPVKANRAPTTADKGYPLGQLWIYSAANESYILVSVVGNTATWNNIETGGGAGAFTTITSTGAFTLDTTTAAANTLGNTTGATSIAMSVGTGGFTLDGVGASDYTIGASTVGGDIRIGGTAQTGDIFLGDSSGTNGVFIGDGTGSTNVFIADNTTAGSITAGSAMTSGTISIGGTGAHTGTIDIAPGTGAQLINIAASGTGIKGINIGATGSANSIDIGSTTGASDVTLHAGTLGVVVDAPFLALGADVFIYKGAGAPGAPLALHVGDLYINTTGSGVADRMYIATGVGTWTNFVTAA